MIISDFNYPLPDDRIARFPLEERDASKLLVWRGGGGGEISETTFAETGSVLPTGSLLVFNNTRVVRARLVMHKPGAGSAHGTSDPARGARIEILCLEPHSPADHERSFASKGSCEWLCMVGNSRKWKSGPLEIPFIYNGAEHKLRARRAGESTGGKQTVHFEWEADLTFGELLELLGRVPIPPYLGREDEAIDGIRYQTVYSRIEGSVAAPTAGLHFTPKLIERLAAGVPLSRKTEFDEVTLHVGAGTFLPVKVENALDHPMHTEHFEATLPTIEHLISKAGNVIAVGTTSVRTLESLAALGHRIARTGGPATGSPDPERPVGQFEPSGIPENFDGATALQTLAAWLEAHDLDRIKASTQIMITPGFTFRVVDGMITNFHQPRSTLLLLIAAFTGGNEWRRIYDHALQNDFRFLSYGDSSLLLRQK